MVWWWRQSRTPLSRSVGPPAVQWSRWCTSHHSGGLSQPGATQRRSRAAMARRWAAVNGRERRPRSRGWAGGVEQAPAQGRVPQGGEGPVGAEQVGQLGGVGGDDDPADRGVAGQAGGDDPGHGADPGDVAAPDERVQGRVVGGHRGAGPPGTARVVAARIGPAATDPAEAGEQVGQPQVHVHTDPGRLRTRLAGPVRQVAAGELAQGVGAALPGGAGPALDLGRVGVHQIVQAGQQRGAVDRIQLGVEAHPAPGQHRRRRPPPLVVPLGVLGGQQIVRCGAPAGHHRRHVPARHPPPPHRPAPPHATRTPPRAQG